jgi:hypothetical protein
MIMLVIYLTPVTSAFTFGLFKDCRLPPDPIELDFPLLMLRKAYPYRINYPLRYGYIAKNQLACPVLVEPPFSINPGIPGSCFAMGSLPTSGWEQNELVWREPTGISQSNISHGASTIFKRQLDSGLLLSWPSPVTASNDNMIDFMADLTTFYVDNDQEFSTTAFSWATEGKNGTRDFANHADGEDMVYEETQNGYCMPSHKSTVEAKQLAIAKNKEDISTTTISQYKQESRASTKKINTVSQVISQCEDQRKRLDPITTKGDVDAIAKRRERNKVAAQKCRDRKARRLEELEEMVRRLEAERDYWKCAAMTNGAIQSLG